MIIVKVELHSGINGTKKEIARMLIDNQGGTDAKGDYRVRTLVGRSASALDRSQRRPCNVNREGTVIGHDRLKLHVWNLVGKALAGIGYDK